MQKPKNLVVILAAVALVIIMGGVAFYFWPRNLATPEPKLLEFKPLRTDLQDWERDKFYNDYLAVEPILEADPDDWQSLLRLGAIKKSIGDYQGAEQAWLRVGELRPGNSVSFNNLGDLYANFLKDYPKAEENYKIALENSRAEAINTTYRRSLFEFYLYYNQELDKAEALLLEGLTDQPENLDLLILLAAFYRDQGQKDKAIEYYQKALKVNPADQSIKKELDKLQATQP